MARLQNCFGNTTIETAHFLYNIDDKFSLRKLISKVQALFSTSSVKKNENKHYLRGQNIGFLEIQK